MPNIASRQLLRPGEAYNQCIEWAANNAIHQSRHRNLMITPKVSLRPGDGKRWKDRGKGEGIDVN